MTAAQKAAAAAKRALIPKKPDPPPPTPIRVPFPKVITSVPPDKPRDPAAKLRKRGRPKKADAPVIPWDEVDRILVFGEKYPSPKTGQDILSFPSLKKIAIRYGVTQTRMWQYAHKAQVFRRREEARLRAEAAYETKVIQQISEQRALAAADVIEVVDDYVFRFRTDLRGGKIRTDSPADLDRLVRLKELLRGNADSRSELHGELSLSAIQDRHRKLRTRQAALSPALTGTIEDAAVELVGDSDGAPRDAGENDDDEEVADGAIH